MAKADEFRKQAEEARTKARKTKSLSESVKQHKREKALNHLADNEDWLDGKTPPKD